MGSRVNEAALKRATAWTFYYLGVIDGMSRTLESFRSLNPEPVNDLEWQTELQSHLPPRITRPPAATHKRRTCNQNNKTGIDADHARNQTTTTQDKKNLMFTSLQSGVEIGEQADSIYSDDSSDSECSTEHPSVQSNFQSVTVVVQL